MCPRRTWSAGRPGSGSIGICAAPAVPCGAASAPPFRERRAPHVAVRRAAIDRKSTRLNSSHLVISYAVFCLKKKKIKFDPFQKFLIPSSFQSHVLIDNTLV